MLNNPKMLRRTMEMASNPSKYKELIRAKDRALSNLESLPGGFSTLERTYRDFQEPLINDVFNMFSGDLKNKNKTSSAGGGGKSTFDRNFTIKK